MAQITITGATKSYGSEPVFTDLTLQVGNGEFLVILGPSGCGKSTLLKVIAGVEPLQTGKIQLDDSDITRMRPGDRDIAMVFQDYALYPNMTVSENLAFTLRSRHVPKLQIAQKVAQTSAALDIGELLDRKPAQLSGGQRQRVALGRAMIRDPRAYLMDEPLSNLDAALRVQMRTELIEFHRRTGGTVIYVTHDQVEAMTMGQRIAVMRAGQFEQIGVPQQVYQRPVSRFVAEFLGSPRMNILSCVPGSEGVRLPGQADPVLLPGWPGGDDPARATVVGFRPETLQVAPPTEGERPGERMTFPVVPVFTEHLGNEVIVHSVLGAAPDVTVLARMEPRRAAALKCDGTAMPAAVSPSDLHLFGADGVAVWHGCDHDLVSDVR